VKRTLAATLLAALMLQASSVPALAMSTSTEIAQGTSENAQIDASSVVVNDPFLTSWTNRVGGQLAQYRHRQDITYRFTVLADPSINAFAIKGGYVHVNVGLLNFVSSDDELAATLGHEMGHVELRHVVKSSNTQTIIGILTALAAILSPVAAIIGGLGGEIVNDKYSRIDELQADHYGLDLMTRAGFDPNAALDVMTKLGQMEPGPEAKADKAFLDHPVPYDRVSHLLGYGALDRPSSQAIVSQAVHDQSEGRYSYAAAKFFALPAARDNPDAVAHVSELDYALRESGPKAAPDGRVFLVAVLPSDPARIAAAKQLALAEHTVTQVKQSIKADARKADAEFTELQHQLDVVGRAAEGGGQYQLMSPRRYFDGVAPPTGAPPSSTPQASAPASSAPAAPASPSTPAASTPAPSSSPTAPARGPQGLPNGGPPGGMRPSDMVILGRLVDGTLQYVGDVIGTAPGLVEGNVTALREMAQPLEEVAPLTPKYQALLRYYPAMTADLSDSTNGLVASIQMSRDAIAQALVAVDAMRTAFHVNQTAIMAQRTGMGTPGPLPPPDLRPAIEAWKLALAAAQRADNRMYAAQAATLSTEITLLDVQSSPERYESFQRALAFRFPGIDIPDYKTSQALHIRPGEIVCASWTAFDTAQTMTAVLDGLKDSNKSCVATTYDRNLFAESLEIATGLVYEDYIDAPQPPRSKAGSSVSDSSQH
jgi:Zn-dependent protease with chaperone function